MKSTINSIKSKVTLRPTHFQMRPLVIVSWAGRLVAIGAALWPLWKQRRK